MTILVVEDEIKITRFIKRGLEMEHYTVDTAYDGQEALDKTKLNNYDLIVLDLMLPKKTELKLLAKSEPIKLRRQ